MKLNSSEIQRLFRERYPVDLWKMRGYYVDDYLNEINEHWLKFEPPSTKSHYILAVIYTIVMLVGITGNALVIFMFLKCKSLRTPAITLVLNLAISDFLMMSKMPIFIYNSLNFGPALGKIACQYYGFIGGLSGTVSICTLSLISLDRYYVIKYPLKRTFTRLRSKLCILFAWSYGILFSSIPLWNIGLGSYVPEGYLTSCSFDYLTEVYEARVFIMVFFVAAWVAPFVLITYTHVSILKIVMKTRNIGGGGGGGLSDRMGRRDMGRDSTCHLKEEARRKQELRLTVTVYLVIGLWFAAWTPYATVSLIGYSGRADLISPLTSMLPALFCKTAGCLDPFIYTLTHQRFKRELRILFCGRHRASPHLTSLSRHSRRCHTTTEVSFRAATRRSAADIRRGYDDGVDEEYIVLGGGDDGRVATPKVSRQSTVSEEVCRVLSTAPSQPRLLLLLRPNFSNKGKCLGGWVRKMSQKKIVREEESYAMRGQLRN